MPHSAFQFEAVNEKIALKIESIETWGDKLLVGTSEGSLLVLAEVKGAVIPEFEVIQTSKDFSRKNIVQLKFCDTLNALVSLSDGIQINSVPSLVKRASLLKTRGATAFAVNEECDPAQLVTIQKRKLSFFRWIDDCFEDWREINLPTSSSSSGVGGGGGGGVGGGGGGGGDECRAIAWCGRNKVCVGMRKEYLLVDVFTDEIQILFSTGSTEYPLVFPLPHTQELLFARDTICVFQDYDGKPTRKYGLVWTSPPHILAYSFPYVVGVGTGVEIVCAYTHKAVQLHRVSASLLVAMKAPKNVPADVFVVSSNSIYRLKPVPLDNQVRQLMDLKEFDAALALAHIAPNTEQSMVKNMHLQYAVHLYSRQNFTEAATHFIRAEADALTVLSLFPDICQDTTKPPPTTPHKLEGLQATQAIAAIVPFLQNAQSRQLSKEEREIVDTALLKALVRTNPSAVLAMLQGPNMCKFAESERILLQHQMYNELVALHKCSANHKRALDLLHEHGQGPKEHPLHGVEPTIQYLRSLGRAYEPLVLDTSRWVLRTDPAQGIKIFMNDDLSDDDSLSPEAVLAHLKQFESDKKAQTIPLRVQYLEYILNTRGNKSENLHNEMVQLYFSTVQAMQRSPDLAPPPTTGRRLPAGSEPGPLGVARKKLLTFLTTSKSYNAQKMLDKFPLNDLYEERALLLGRLGKHDDALAIYIHGLQNYRLAEEYCDRVYDPESQTSSTVHLSLLSALLNPPDAAAAESSSVPAASLLQQAMGVMSRHVDKIDPAKALDLVPSTTSVRAVSGFLEAALRANDHLRRAQQVHRNLMKTEGIKVWEQWNKGRSRRVVISADRICRLCNRRIGHSAFACYPNMVVVHFSCAKDKNVCPVTNTVFGESEGGAAGGAPLS